MKIASLILVMFTLMGGCASDSSGSSSDMSTAKAEANYSEAEQASGKQVNNFEERKIIRTADIRFQVENLEASTARIETMVGDANGFISDSNQNNSSYSINSILTIRVPAENFEAFLERVEKESIFTNYKRIKAQDVSEEYVDITTRLATKKEVRDRYVDILRNKAKTVEDILAAEEKIRVVQEEIESVEGRLKFLNNRTTMSTISVDIYQELEGNDTNVYKKSYFSKLKESFANGWDLIEGLSLGVVMIWPLLLLFGIGYFLRKRFWKKTK